jgi:hypothetical protein
MNQPEPELTTDEIKAIMDMQAKMIKHMNGLYPWKVSKPIEPPWEMFFAE